MQFPCVRSAFFPQNFSSVSSQPKYLSNYLEMGGQKAYSVFLYLSFWQKQLAAILKNPRRWLSRNIPRSFDQSDAKIFNNNLRNHTNNKWKLYLSSFGLSCCGWCSLKLLAEVASKSRKGQIHMYRNVHQAYFTCRIISRVRRIQSRYKLILEIAKLIRHSSPRYMLQCPVFYL